MRVRRFPDAAAFLDAAEVFLTEREAFHNLPLGVARTSRNDPSRYPGPNYFAVVEDDGRIVGVAAMTPPHLLQLYVPPGPAVEAVARDVADGWSPPGVHGPVAVADAFAALWCERTGVGSRVRMNLRAFEVTEVRQPARPPGAMRVAEEADLPIVGSWFRAFEEEALAAKGSVPPDEAARRAVGNGRIHLWDDGGPVAQTSVGHTPNGARIGAVYTPPHMRRRGYATALVAGVSQRELDQGRKFCFLFTDLANPISNSIYQRIGYRPVADMRDHEFVTPPASAPPAS